MPVADFLKIFAFIIVVDSAYQSIAIAKDIGSNKLETTDTSTFSSRMTCEVPKGWRLRKGNNTLVALVPEYAIVHVKCPEGFNQVGTKKVTCLKGGVWDNNFPSCVLSWTKNQEIWRLFSLSIRPPVLTPEFTSTTPQETEQTADDSTTTTELPINDMDESSSSPADDDCEAGSFKMLSCPYPFELDGQPFQYCLPNGTWATEEVKCKLIDSLGIPDEQVTTTSAPPTRPVIFSPRTKPAKLPLTTRSSRWPPPTRSSRWPPPTRSVKLQTNMTITSTSTQSTQYVPEMGTEAVTSLPTNGMSESSSSATENCEAGAILTYTCPHPFEVDGETVLECPPIGKWEVKAPKCKRICGKRDPKIPTIINGSPSQRNEFPWQVALSKEESYLIYCAGVLISDKFVLTAAHCITEPHTNTLLDPNTLLMYFGKHYTDQNVDMNISRKVSNLYLNPKYDPISLESDLGLVQLETVVEVSYIVMPLCLPRSNSTTTYQVGETGAVAGWGYSSNNGSRPTVLNMIELPIVSSEKCEASYVTHQFTRTVTENMFCAGVEEGGKSTCSGDSGGAMAFFDYDRYVLEGIVSWGNIDDCAAPGFYAGFVRVRNFLTWITGFV